MDALILRLRHNREDISLDVEIDTGKETRVLGRIWGLSLTDVEWLIRANSSEHTTPFIVEVAR